jgi:hypothetical protein
MTFTLEKPRLMTAAKFFLLAEFTAFGENKQALFVRHGMPGGLCGNRSRRIHSL